MRYLVENGAYRLDNLGDVAMLRLTVERILRHDPAAHVSVVTEAPDRLRQLLPQAHAVPASAWFRMPVTPLPGRLRWHRRVRPLVERLRRAEERWQQRFPRLANRGKLRHLAEEPHEADAVREFFAELVAADAVVCCGGGLINDWFHDHSRKILATLGAAQGLDKPTAMFGLGLGPLTHQPTIRLARPVLRRLDVLTLREDECGPRTLHDLGIGRSVEITGDDAIELPHATGPARPAAAIGVNLRLAPHAQVPEGALAELASAVRGVAGALAARLVPLPIRCVLSPDHDVEALRRWLGDDAADFSEAEAMLDPQQVIEATGRCRLVVTGAYHTAIFALARGVPVIGLARSDYYQAKLSGAAKHFERGMEVLRFDDPQLCSRFDESARRLWDEQPALLEPLRRAAAEQVERSRRAYERFFARLPRPAPQIVNARAEVAR